MNDYDVAEGIISEHVLPHVLICSMLLTVQVDLCDQQGGLTGKPPWAPAGGCGTLVSLPLGGLREGGVLRRVSFKSLTFSNSIYKKFRPQ